MSPRRRSGKHHRHRATGLLVFGGSGAMASAASYFLGEPPGSSRATPGRRKYRGCCGVHGSRSPGAGMNWSGCREWDRAASRGLQGREMDRRLGGARRDPSGDRGGRRPSFGARSPRDIGDSWAGVRSRAAAAQPGGAGVLRRCRGQRHVRSGRSPGGGQVDRAQALDLLGYRDRFFGDPIDWHLDPVSGGGLHPLGRLDLSTRQRWATPRSSGN